MFLRIFSFLFFIIFSISVFAQSESIALLRQEISLSKSDTQSIRLKKALADELLLLEPSEALKEAQEAFSLAEQLVNQNPKNVVFYALKADCLSQLGDIYQFQNQYVLASDYHYKALKIREIAGNKMQIAQSHLSIGEAERLLGNFVRALDSYFEALKIYENLNNIEGLTNTYLGIGNIQQAQDRFASALDYYGKALEIAFSKIDSSSICNNLGQVYFKQGNYEKALEFFEQSYQLDEKLGDDLGRAYTLNNIGEVYQKQGKLNLAENQYLKSIQLKKMAADDFGLAYSFNRLGELKNEQKRHQEALNLFKQAKNICQKIGNKQELQAAYLGISTAYAGLKKFNLAFQNHQKFTEIQQEIAKQGKALTQIEINYLEEKKEQERIIQEELRRKEDRLFRYSLIAGFLILALIALMLFTQNRLKSRNNKELAHKNKIIQHEKQRSDELLLNILPLETAEELKKNGITKAKRYDEVTVLFTDFKGFTKISEQLSPEELVHELHSCFKVFDRIMGRFHVEKIKTIGDAYMCVGGLPIPNKNAAADVVKAGLEIQKFMKTLKANKQAQNKPYFEARVGIHTGPVVAGVVGIKKFAYDIWGDTVNTASRIESSSEVEKVNISEATYNLVKDEFNCIYRGKIEAKNKGKIDMYFVEGFGLGVE